VIEAGYSLSEVSKLLGLSRSIVTGLIDAGFVSPARGRRKEYRFTFQDLVMLRAARGLTAAGLSSTRILRSLRRLKSQLPDATLTVKKDAADWSSESFAAAKQTVYTAPIGMGGGPFTLTPAYKTKAKALARKRIALAGVRLANLLNEELK